MAGDNENSKKALAAAATRKQEVSRKNIKTAIAAVEAEVKKKRKDRTDGALPKSYSQVCKEYGIPKSTVDLKHNADLKERLRRVVEDIRNPPIDPTVQREYQARIKQLEAQVRRLSEDNMRLAEELDQHADELAMVRKHNANLTKKHSARSNVQSFESRKGP